MRYQVMLAKLGDKALLEKTTPKWIFEPKFDGTRVLIYKDGNDIELINRRGRDITYRYPELLDIPLNIKAKQCVLDAELVVLDKQGKPSFNLLQQREQLDRKIIIDVRSRSIPATLFVFDLLELEGKQFTEKPLKERKEELNKIIVNGPFLTICPTTSNGRALWKKVQEQELEGIMAKDLSSKYEQGKRSWQWLKIKNLNTIDAIVVGFTKGERSRANTFGALVLAAYKKDKKDKLIYIGRVGTGFDEKLLQQLTKMMKKLITKKPALSEEEQKKIYAGRAAHEIEITWIKPEVTAEIKYLELTKALELRAPSFMRLRFDKRPRDCVLES